jgi:hypothetical protein
VLEVSAGLFAAYGLVSCGVGVMLLFVINADRRPVGFGMFHPRPDSVVFGEFPVPDDLQRPFAILRAMHWHWLGGVMLSFGVLQLGVIWFGLLGRQPWALAVLTLADLAMLPHWVLVFRPYWRACVCAGWRSRLCCGWLGWRFHRQHC